MGFISDYNRAVEERKRVYQEPIDPLKAQQMKVELMKMRVDLAKQQNIQKTEFVNKFGTVMAAQQGMEERVFIAAINAKKSMNVAEINKQAQLQSTFTSTFGAAVLEAHGATKSARTAQENVENLVREKFSGKGNNYGVEVANSIAAGGDLKQALKDNLTQFDEVFVKQDNEIARLTPQEKFYAKDVGASRISEILAKSVVENNPQLSTSQVQQEILSVLKTKAEFINTPEQTEAYSSNLEAQNAILSRAATQRFGGASSAGIQKLIDQALDAKKTPSMTIKEFASDFEKIPDDPAIVKLEKDLTNQMEQIDERQTTAFGEFYLKYINDPNKDTLNRIIGVQDDKNAAYFYLTNENMLQTAVAGIQKFQDPTDPSLVDAYEPGQPLPEDELIKLRNTIASDLGIRTLRNVNPTRLRLAMAVRTPLRFDPTVQKSIQQAEEAVQIEEEVLDSPAQEKEIQVTTGKFRTVKGKAGYVYGQDLDGNIYILKDPTGKATGMKYAPDHRFGKAITGEIGTVDSVPKANFTQNIPSSTVLSGLKRSRKAPKSPTPTKSIEKQTQQKGAEAAEQFDVLKGIRIEEPNLGESPPSEEDLSPEQLEELFKRKRSEAFNKMQDIRDERAEIVKQINDKSLQLIKSSKTAKERDYLNSLVSQVGKQSTTQLKDEIKEKGTGQVFIGVGVPNKSTMYDVDKERKHNENLKNILNQYENKYGEPGVSQQPPTKEPGVSQQPTQLEQSTYMTSDTETPTTPFAPKKTQKQNEALANRFGESQQ